MNNLKINVKELPILVSYTILSFLFCIQFSAIVVNTKRLIEIIGIIEYVFYILLTICIFTSKKYTLRELIIISICFSVGIIIKINTGYGWMLFVSLLVTSVKGIEFKKICKVIFWGIFIGTTIVLLLYVLGISDSGIKRRGFSGYGFSHPNNFSELILVMCFLQVFLIRKEIKIINVKMLIIAILNYLLLGNRSVSIILIVYPGMVWLLRYLYKSKKRKFLMAKNILIMSFPICQFFSVITAILYTKFPSIQTLSMILNSRIFEAYYNLNYFGYSLFGVFTNFSEYTYDPTRNLYFSYNVLDNSYIGVLIEMGIIASIIWGIAHMASAKKMDTNREVELLAIYILSAIYGMIESSFRVVFVDFTIFYLLSNHNYILKEYCDN